MVQRLQEGVWSKDYRRECGPKVTEGSVVQRLQEGVCTNCRIQPTVTFPIGDHVNVLHNYKKM